MGGKAAANLKRELKKGGLGKKRWQPIAGVRRLFANTEETGKFGFEHRFSFREVILSCGSGLHGKGERGLMGK